MFKSNFSEIERFSPYAYRASVELNDEAMKEDVCRELIKVKEATEAMAQIDIDDIDNVENAVEDIVSAVRAVKRAKTRVARNNYRKTKYEVYMNALIKNTEVGGMYVMSRLMDELTYHVRHNFTIGFDPEMFRTVMDVLIENGTFKATKIGPVTVFVRER
ncbi:MAG: hypothetical protein J6W35_07035 [Eubacterium sp.]|nr:hypothetical protein [Eubacterium sp.]